LGTKSTSYA